jgi:hypothetical protein
MLAKKIIKAITHACPKSYHKLSIFVAIRRK